MNKCKEFLYNFYLCVRHNIINLVAFELIFSLALKFAFWPILEKILNLSVWVSNTPYLYQSNVTALLNPLSILILLIFLFLTGYLILVEINALIINYRNKSQRIPFWKLGLLSCQESLKIFLPKNWGILFFVLFVIPIQNGPFVTSVARIIKVPGFILEYIHSDSTLNILYFCLLVVLAVIVFFGTFTFHEMNCKNTSFFKSYINSVKLVKHHLFRTFFSMLFAVSGIWLLFKVLELGAFILTAVILRNIFPVETAQLIYANIYMVCSYAIGFVQYLFVFSFCISAISAMYFSYNNIEEKNIKKPIINWRRSTVAIIMFLCIIGVSALSGLTTIHGKENILVSAHRAGGAFAPENTISALNTSIDFEADYAEIDIQQLKDGNLILSHDTNFKRISKENKNVWDVNLDEVKTYDAGSFFSDDFAEEKYPTIEECFACAKDKINLIIELKYTGHEDNIEQKTLDAVNAYGMKNQVIIASMYPSILENVKNIDSSFNTQLISAVAIGSYSSMEYADSLSIEASFATPELLSKIHMEGKKLFVWTVNDEETSRKMINMNVDSILTDNVISLDLYLSDSSGNECIDIISEFYISKEIDLLTTVEILFNTINPLVRTL